MADLSVQPQVFVVARLYVYIFFILTFYILISTIAYLPQRREVLQSFCEITFHT